MSDLSQLLPSPKTLTLGGRDWLIKPLSFNQLAELEARYGSLSEMKLDAFAEQRWFMWLLLRGQDKALTEDDLGEMLTLDKIGEISTFLADVFELSGLKPENKDEPADPNALAAGDAAATSPITSAGSSSAPGSRRKTPGN